MKYCIVQGIVHPKLCEDLSCKNIVFYDICDSELGLPLIKNLMKDILNPNKDNNIRFVMEDFFKIRAIDVNGDNIYVKNIVDFFNAFEEYYNKKMGLNFYLVKKEGNKIVDILDKWQCKRESKTFYAKRNKKKNIV